MTDIEDRGLCFRSYKKHNEFLSIEIKKLQQLLPQSDINKCFKGAIKEFTYHNPDYFKKLVRT